MNLITWRHGGSRDHPIEYNPAQKHADRAVVIKTLRWAACVGLLLMLGWAAVLEVRTSFVQAQLFARWAKKMTYTVSLGPNSDMRFPRGGPYDERKGYTKLSSFVAALRSDHFSIARQAKLSPAFKPIHRRWGLCDLPRKGSNRSHGPRSLGLAFMCRGLPRAHPHRLVLDSASRDQHAAVPRRPLSAPATLSRSQSGDRLEALSGGGRGPLWRLVRS